MAFGLNGLFQGIAVLQLQAVADDIPEEQEMFYLSLLPPEGGAKLGSVSRKTVIIERNDAPYGLIEIFISGSRYKLLLYNLYMCTVHSVHCSSDNESFQVSSDILSSSLDIVIDLT